MPGHHFGHLPLIAAPERIDEKTNVIDTHQGIYALVHRPVIADGLFRLLQQHIHPRHFQGEPVFALVRAGNMLVDLLVHLHRFIVFAFNKSLNGGRITPGRPE